MTRTAHPLHVSPAVPPRQAQRAFLAGSFDARHPEGCAGQRFELHAVNVRRIASLGIPMSRGNRLVMPGEHLQPIVVVGDCCEHPRHQSEARDGWHLSRASVTTKKEPT